MPSNITPHKVHFWPGSGRGPITSINPSDKASTLRTNLQKLTVKPLQAQLRERGLPVSGRKAALVDRLLESPGSLVAAPQKFTDADRDWDKKILAAGAYSDILPSEAMPFVNRRYELFQLLCQNIDAIRILLDEDVTNFRRLKVCFSAQTFGAGKTTLGDKFLSQIKSEEFEVYARKMISNRSPKNHDDWVAEWQRAKGARQLYVDARGRRTVRGVLDVIRRREFCNSEKLWRLSESFCRLGSDHCISRTGQSPFRARRWTWGTGRWRLFDTQWGQGHLAKDERWAREADAPDLFLSIWQGHSRWGHSPSNPACRHKVDIAGPFASGEWARPTEGDLKTGGFEKGLNKKKVRLLLFAVEAGSCRTTFLLHAFRFLLFQFDPHFEWSCLRPWWSGVLFKCTGFVVTFRLLCFEMPISQRRGAKRHLAEHTHTYKMSYMRCLKDTATAGTGLVDAEAVQPEYQAFFGTARIHSGKKRLWPSQYSRLCFWKRYWTAWFKRFLY